LSFDAISPIDGRYRAEAEPLASFFSERAFTRRRVAVELDYLRLLSKSGVAPAGKVPKNVEVSMDEFKSAEEKTGHDVKAIEHLIRARLNEMGLRRLSPYVHLGLTSEDTNGLAFAMLINGAFGGVLVPAYSRLSQQLAKLAFREANTKMLARTHGRPAVPTTFGKEMAVFAIRLAERTSSLSRLRATAKFSGAVGTYASFNLLGRKDWPTTLRKFVEDHGVGFSEYSTQVSPAEGLSDMLHHVMNVNQLLVSLARDLWAYQTLDYLRFVRPGKVSSSTMPQKVNPVDVENAEGQAEVSNALLGLLAYRLEVTRMQRDLSDSVLRRMVGQGLAHSLVAASRLASAVSSMEVERTFMAGDLARHPEVMAESEQIRLRLAGDEAGYEKVRTSLREGNFVPSMGPGEYLGSAPDLARRCPGQVRRMLSPSS